MKVLKLGAKYKSAVCDAQIMVIRTIAEPVDLRCGGVAMLDAGAAAPDGVALDPAFADGALIGKRYVDAGDRIELLCTKGGKVKQAKALPSSD